MDIVAADILSGLPVTEDGLHYILVLTDYFTKWACAFALPDAEVDRSCQNENDTFPSTVRWSDRTHEPDVTADVKMYGR